MTHLIAPYTAATDYWHTLDDGKIQCDVCPRHCKLQEGQQGLCFVRARQHNQIVMTSYGRSSGFCVDPIEKKPLNHFYPGTSVLSFGTAGCNLACKFCQNWDMSKSRETQTLAQHAFPQDIVTAAKKFNCPHIAFTYNDPIIFLEYAIDVAIACREAGIHSVAVSAGYVDPAPRRLFFKHMDAANIDLKAFTDKFYYEICGAHLNNVLDTLMYIKHETNTWLEITTLLIPDENDSDQEIDAMTTWIQKELGPDVPLHFTAFHPDWKMRDKKATPIETLARARHIAIQNGLHYVYTGNVHDKNGSSTYCPQCHNIIIERDWYELSDWQIVVPNSNTSQGLCAHCQTPITGRFLSQPGQWGAQRLPVRFV